MWQRIQTLYILIATLLTGLMFFMPKGVVMTPETADNGIIMFTGYIPYAVFLVVITFLHIVALMAYKFRVFQLRTVMLAAIIIFAFQIWLGVDFYFTRDDVAFKIAAVFPIAALIMDLLAYRNILADQLLVESAYSLRRPRKERRAGRRNSRH